MASPFRVAIYSRVSTSHHEQNPEVQLFELRRYCTARDWQIAFEIVDHGHSGGTENRPGLKQLLNLIRSRQVDLVIVTKLDRLFRSLKHLVTALEELESLGVQFIAIKDNVDWTTPAGRFFIQILGSLAEFEKSLLRERTVMGLEHAKAMGKKLGRPVIHSKAEILHLRSQGLSYRQIQKKLNCPLGCVSRAVKSERKTSP